MRVKTDIRRIITKIVTYYAGEIGVEVEFTLQDGIFSITREDIWVFVNNTDKDIQNLEKELEYGPQLCSMVEEIYSQLRPYHDKKLKVSEMNELIKKIKKFIVKTLDKIEK